MSDELATVASFWSPLEANLAKNRLDAAGIPSFLCGEEVVAMSWPLLNAVGGIKLQVAARDVDQAQVCLAEVSADHEASAAAVLEEEAQPATTAREQNADRAWRGAALGLLFFPLHFYVFYLLVKVYLSEEELRDEHRRHAWMAAAINLPLLFLSCLILRALLAP